MVWVATERGVDIYDPHNEAIDSVFGAEGAQESAVSALMTDSRGDVWIGLADQGIDIVPHDGARRAGCARPAQARYRPAQPHDPGAGRGRTGRSLDRHQLGCTTPATMARRSSGAAAAAQPYPRIGALLVRKGELWLGTYEGLLRYNPATGALRHYVQGRRKAAA
jgi:ligand-binding sensor domain-containing protein